MSEVSDLIEEAVIELQHTTDPYPTWVRKGYPKGSHWTHAFNALNKAHALTPVPTPTPDPSLWAVADPADPITTVLNPGLGLNVNNQVGAPYSDYIISNTSNSGILLQGNTYGCRFNRFHITGIDAQSPSVQYGVHGIYGKAHDNFFYDFFLDGAGGNSHYLGSGISNRMGGNLYERFVIQNMMTGLSHFEYDHVVRPAVVFRNIKIRNVGNDTICWMDDDAGDGGSTQVIQPFVFDNLDTAGPMYACKVSPGKYVGAGIDVYNWIHNGHKVTASDFAGFAPSDIRIHS